jgi:glycosyltransferase involved in cell wall biosynthesis
MCPWLAVHSGFPHIVTYHGILRELWKQPTHSQRIRLRLEDEVFRRAENVIIISPAVERMVYGNQPPSRPRRFPIPNPIAREFFEYESGPRDVDLAMVGMIYPLKQTHLIVPIIECLQAKGINATAHVFGGPVHAYRSYARDICREIQGKGLGPCIQLRGQIENGQLPAELARCRILLHLSDFESYSMAIREAMALGLVIVARPVGAIPDLIKDGVNGLLLPAGDLVDEASMVVAQLLAREAEMAQLGEEARRCVRETCDPDLVAAKHFEAYCQVSGC